MNSEEKLKAIIEKAYGVEAEFDFSDDDNKAWLRINIDFWNGVLIASAEQLIFSHDFLKAYFAGESCDCGSEDESHFENCQFTVSDWQYHAQQLAITPEEERIDYLYKFV